MLDFKRLDFNKQFSLTPKKIINIQTKWKLEKLSNLIEAKNVINGFAFKSKNLIDNKADDTFLPVLKIGNIITNQYEVGFKKNTQFHIYKNYKSKICDNGDLAIALTGATVGKSGWVKEKCLLNQRVLAIKKGQKDLDYFSIYILSNNFYEYAQSFAYGGAQGNLSPEQTLDFKIPLPPKDIQRKIVKDCEAIDKEKEKSEQNIRKAISEIEKSYETLFAKANKEFRLSNSKDFKAFIGKRVIQKEIEDTETGTPIYSANVFQPFGYINKEFITDFSMDSVLWGIDGDWMVNVIEKNKPFYPTDHCGVLRVLTNEIHPKYLAWVLLKEGEKVRFSRSHRASTERVKGIKIKAPSITEQNKAVKQIEKQEQIIAKSKETIENIADRKQAVLKNYL